MALTITDQILLGAVPGSEASRGRLNALLLANQSDNIDWEELFQRVGHHQLTPLLRYGLAGIGSSAHIPAWFQDKLDEEGRLWAARHLATAGETIKLVDRLQSEGIRALPLKGAALMVAGYYPEAGLRTATDIDLLVDPSRIEDARILLTGHGYQSLPGRRDVRPRQRLANEMNHLWPLRSPGGSIIELHHRAFHLAAHKRDLDFQLISADAVIHKLDSGHTIELPSPHDLALHLIHHTLIDLQSTHLSLRTMADLHAILLRHPESRANLLQRADYFGVTTIVETALDLTGLLANGSTLELIDAEKHAIYGLMLGVMLDSESDVLAETARIFEYFDLSRQPLRKIGNIGALIFTTGDHLDQLYGKPKFGLRLLQYLHRPLDLIRRFHWRIFRPSSLLRVRKLRNIVRRS